MSVRIVVDSAADIPAAQAAQRGIWHAPLKTVLAGEEYRDGVDLTPDVFYQKLAESKGVASTSQASVAEFSDLYAAAAKEGSEVLVITLSSGISGTYQSAVTAAADYPDRVYVVDSLSATAGEQVLVERAIAMRDAGASAAEIHAELETLKKRLRLFFRVETLEYLKRGGRISKTAAFVGGMLHFMPVLAFNGKGKLETVGRARGLKMSHKLLNDCVKAAGGIDWSMPVAITYAGNLEDGMVRAYLNDGAELFAGHEDKLIRGQLGCVIGAHTGPGAIVIAFIAKEK